MAGEEYVIISISLSAVALLISVILAFGNSKRADKRDVLQLAENISKERMDMQHRLAILEGRQAERDNAFKRNGSKAAV